MLLIVKMLSRGLNNLFKFQLNFRFSSQSISSIQNVYNKSFFVVDSKMESLLKNIRLTLSCSEKTALTVYQKFPSIRSFNAINRIKPNISLLLKNGVSKESIADNQFLLILKIGWLLHTTFIYLLFQLNVYVQVHLSVN